jgi:hypothetical protein
MVREKSKWRTHKGESTEAGYRDGMARSSEEIPVMGMERRGHIVQLCVMVNRKGGAVE